MKPASVLWAVLLLAVLVRINSAIWPVPWPDEALFSSPAQELSSGRPFTTPVLSGLIYGMDRATLWNCPLHMVLLSLVYRITGESLEAGRFLSLVLGCLALLTFYSVVRRYASAGAALLGACSLALSPVFQRAANTIRMDMLTLLLMLVCLRLLLEARNWNNPRSHFFALLAGASAGLALMSHPFAVILLPVILLFTLPSWSMLWRAAAGAAAGFSPWAVYIARYPEIFEAQFLAQLMRKWLLAQNVTKGETGGLHQVFFSQYGFYDGTKAAMIVAALLYAAAGLICFVYVIRRVKEDLFRSTEPESSRDRMILSFGMIAGFAYVSTEGWYVVYGDTFLVLASVLLYSRKEAPGLTARLQRSLLPVSAAVFALLTLYFTVHNLQTANREQSSGFITSAVRLIATCKSVYVRIRPDPYFDVRRSAPQVRYSEFIPGKLEPLPEHEALLYATWDATDCFLIDQYDTWEPRLTDYLARNRARFEMTDAGAYAPLRVQARLYRRRGVL